ncbi:hypothetical protein Ahy_A05g023232 isoform E [Arachis hypogaea]|nr:hypothetical protein Ahy_A05g023232 isoform E [Arachis hypogaea]
MTMTGMTPLTPSTLYTEGSECARGENGSPKFGSHAKRAASGSEPSPPPTWQRVHTTPPLSPSKAPPPSSTSPNSHPLSPAPPPTPPATSRQPPPKPPQ